MRKTRTSSKRRSSFRTLQHLEHLEQRNLLAALPSIQFNGETTVQEGQILVQEGRIVASSSSWSVMVDFGDGSGWQAPSSFSYPFFYLNHYYADDGAYDVHVKVSSTMSSEEVERTLAVTVENFEPTLAVFGNDSVDEGSAYQLRLGQPIDAGDDTVSQYVIGWGDGESTVVAAADMPADRSFSHVYADGTILRKIAVTLVDEDGLHQHAGSKFVTVQDVAPRLDLIGAPGTAEGDAYELTLGPVIDPGADVVALYTVHWGDGDSTIISAGDLNPERTLSHVYANGTEEHVIRVDLQDEDSVLVGPQLDTSFGNGGWTHAGFTRVPGYESGFGVVVDPVTGGFTVISASFGAWLVRYTAAGELDTSFGNQGRAPIGLPLFFTPSNGAIATDSQGRIYVGGSYSENHQNAMAVARFTTSGNLDTTFGASGLATANFFESFNDNEYAYDVVIDAQDRILLMGSTRLQQGEEIGAFARLTIDGQLDPSFGDDGKLPGLSVIPFGGALTPDQHLIVEGYNGEMSFLRYDLDGNLDSEFVPLPIEYPENMGIGSSLLAVDLAGNILLPGMFNTPEGLLDFGLVQYDPQGALIGVFSYQLAEGYDYAVGIAVAPSGEVLLAGSVYDEEFGVEHIAWARVAAENYEFDSSGITVFPAYTFDSGHGIAPIPHSGGASIALVDVDSSFAFVKVLADGSLDSSFGTDGLAPISSDLPLWPDRMVVDTEGNILAVLTGTGLVSFARFTPEGELDLDFGTDGVAHIDLPFYIEDTADLVLDDAGRILVAVRTISEDNDSMVGVVRLLADGTLDESYGSGGYSVASSAGEAWSLALTPAGGSVLEVRLAEYVYGIMRFSETGEIDSALGVDGFAALELPEATGLNGGITIDQAGYIYVATGAIGSSFEPGVARYDSSGALDRTFGIDGVWYTPPRGFAFEQANLDVHIDDQNRLLIAGVVTNLANLTQDILVGRIILDPLEATYKGAGELSVTVANVAPTPDDDATTIAESETSTVDVLLQASDPADAITFVAGSAAIASAIDEATGESVTLATASIAENGSLLTFDPGSDFAYLNDGETATVVVSYSIGDGEATVVGYWTITINGAGQTQAIELSVGELHYTETEVQAAITSSGASSTPSYTVANVSRSGGGAIHAASDYSIDAEGVFHWTPGAGQLGSYVFEVVANGQPETAVQFTVTTLGVADGVLTIVGTGGADTIIIKPTDHDPTKLSVRIDEHDLEFSLRPRQNPDNPYLDVDFIRIFALDGADEVNMRETVATSAEVHGGAGADQLRGGHGHDVIFGDSGNDQIWGDGGDDFLIGGMGNDILKGQEGNDILLAGDLAANFNASFANLRAISAAWALLNPSSDLADNNADGDIVNDGLADQLDGGQGSDWFLTSNNDTIDYNAKKNKDGDKLTEVG